MLNQVGAWQPSTPVHNGRPCLVPNGIYFDYAYGTAGAALEPSLTTPV